jgi:hypothetical protein
MTLLELVTAIRSLTTAEHQEVAKQLVSIDDYQAERLKNAIAVAQQESDMEYMALHTQRMKARKLEDFDSVSGR